MIVIGIGGWTDDLELTQMASAPHHKNKVDVRNFNDLQGITQQLIDMVCDSKFEQKHTYYELLFKKEENEVFTTINKYAQLSAHLAKHQ